MDTFLSFIADHWLLLLVAAMSILFAAFFAASETAIVFANKTRIRELAEAGNARARAVILLLEERDRLHSTLLLAENFFIVLAAALGTVAAMHLFADTAVSIAGVGPGVHGIRGARFQACAQRACGQGPRAAGAHRRLPHAVHHDAAFPVRPVAGRHRRPGCRARVRRACPAPRW